MKQYVIGPYYKIVQKRGPFVSEHEKRERIEAFKRKQQEKENERSK